MASEMEKLFLQAGIRIAGTADAPLFCARDVAAHIRDKHLARYLKGLAATYVQQIQAADPRGHKRATAFFTEKGLYRYLLQSRRAEAASFQGLAYDLLAAERRRVVNAARLEAKIARDEATRLTHANAVLRSDLHRAVEPRLAVPHAYIGEFLEFCFDHLAWSGIRRRPELEQVHDQFDLPGALVERIEELWRENRGDEALERFEAFFALHPRPPSQTSPGCGTAEQ